MEQVYEGLADLAQLLARPEGEGAAAAGPHELPQQLEQQQEHEHSRGVPGPASSCGQCQGPPRQPAPGGGLSSPSRSKGSTGSNTGQQPHSTAALLAELAQLQADKLLLQGQVSHLQDSGTAAESWHAQPATHFTKHPRSLCMYILCVQFPSNLLAVLCCSCYRCCW